MLKGKASERGDGLRIRDEGAKYLASTVARTENEGESQGFQYDLHTSPLATRSTYCQLCTRCLCLYHTYFDLPTFVLRPHTPNNRYTAHRLLSSYLLYHRTAVE